MTTDFRILFSVSIAHAFYSTGGRDFDFVVPSDVRQTLKDGRMVAKVRDGMLYVLFETDGTGPPRVPVAGSKLRFGLKLRNPNFGNFTELDFDFGRTFPLYRNGTAHGTLDGARASVLVGSTFRHTPSSSGRPVTLTLKDDAGTVLQMDTITATGDSASVLYDLTGRGPRAYSVEEVYPGESATVSYYSDLELFQSGVFGVVEIKVDGAFTVAPASLRIAFQTRADTLKYYIVAGNYTDTDFSQLTVEDAGFTDDIRPQIQFTRVDSDEFGPDDISPALLGPAEAKVVLFKSQALVPRREKARKKIQLSKNGDVLIPHLPQVGSDKVNGDIIIHLSKP